MVVAEMTCMVRQRRHQMRVQRDVMDDGDRQRAGTVSQAAARLTLLAAGLVATAARLI